ncbi:unnamed protein product [Mytilus coruscus]|uniref:B box-type domain-containing protein n=1 Tax=Mytilus coruscus TaxID=42192 RepID=A0A6J8CYC6_MYTCO|nr:unnamed protein product [Mytilus coruscus]
MDDEDEERRLFLRLYYFCIDKSMCILGIYMNTFLLFNSSFEDFLNTNKHEIFHKWNATTPCCKCITTASLAASNKKSYLKKDQIEMLYKFDGQATVGHEQITKKQIKQYCICSMYAIPDIETDTIDISTAYCIIKTCSDTLFKRIENPLETIKRIRNKLSHLYGGKINKALFNTEWAELEKAVLIIVGYISPSLPRYEQKQIDKLKNENVKVADVYDKLSEWERKMQYWMDDTKDQLRTEIVNDIRKVLKEDSQSFQVHDDQLTFQIQVETKKHEYCDHKEERTSTNPSSTRTTSSEIKRHKIMNIAVWLMNSLVLVQRKLAFFFTAVANKMLLKRTDQRQLEEINENEQNGDQRQLEKNNENEQEDNTDDDTGCVIEINIRNLKGMENKDTFLKLPQLKDIGKIQINFAYKGSLVIVTTIPIALVTNKSEFQEEMRLFLTRLVQEFNIDNKIRKLVEVKLTVLSSFEEALNRYKVNSSKADKEKTTKKMDKDVQVDISECPRCLLYEIERNQMYRTWNWIAYSKTKVPTTQQLKSLVEIEKDSSENYEDFRNNREFAETEQIDLNICMKCDVSLYDLAYWCKRCQQIMCEKCIAVHQLQTSSESKNIDIIQYSDYGLEIGRKPLKRELVKNLYDTYSEYELINSFQVDDSEVRCIELIDERTLVLGFPDKLHLVVCTISNEIQKVIYLKNIPWDTAAVGDKKMVVCYGSERNISFVDITSGKIDKDIWISEECYGINYKNGELYAGSFSGVNIITMTGELKRKIAIDGFLPYCFCISDNNCLFYTHYAENKIICINAYGIPLFTRSYPNMTKPCGIKCDENDDVYVAFGGSSTIYRLRPNGEAFDVIFSFCPPLTSFSTPRLCYDSVSKCLFASSFEKLGIVRIFKQKIFFNDRAHSEG